MKTVPKARWSVRMKYSACFLFLAVAVLLFVLRNMGILEFQHWANSIIIVQTVSTGPDMHQGFCTFQPLTPKDALEEHLLLDSIAWPETPLLPSPLPPEKTSHPAHSTFTILSRRGGGQWHVGDQLHVIINMFDFQGRPKKSGGDFLLARLHNQKLGAGVVGQVVDHLNGSYSALFSLLWEGDAQVEVLLVHSSEAVTVLNRLTSERPDRTQFRSLFRSGSHFETTNCNVCLRPTQPLCNYTDLRTGEPWFCYKPKNLSCDARTDHAKIQEKVQPKEVLNHNETMLFQSSNQSGHSPLTSGINEAFAPSELQKMSSGVNIKVYIRPSGPVNVTVVPKEEGEPEVKNSSVKSGPSGYYYQGEWRALDGTTVRQFSTSSTISQCLKGKVVHMYGDSTVRQWFEFLNAALPELKWFNLHSPMKVGPLMALDHANNILVTFRCHAPPLSFTPQLTSELRYIANELDGLNGGTNTVVVFGIWAHFSTFPIEVYIRRLQSIRRAVVRLLDRAPGTLVVIRTGNPKTLRLNEVLIHSDWYSLRIDKVLRAMFKGLNVHLVDAWEMVVAHHLPHSLHPQPPIIKNMIDVLLSYTCPQKSS